MGCSFGVAFRALSSSSKTRSPLNPALGGHFYADFQCRFYKCVLGLLRNITLKSVEALLIVALQQPVDNSYFVRSTTYQVSNFFCFFLGPLK